MRLQEEKFALRGQEFCRARSRRFSLFDASRARRAASIGEFGAHLWASRSGCWRRPGERRRDDRARGKQDTFTSFGRGRPSPGISRASTPGAAEPLHADVVGWSSKSAKAYSRLALWPKTFLTAEQLDAFVGELQAVLQAKHPPIVLGCVSPTVVSRPDAAFLLHTDDAGALLKMGMKWWEECPKHEYPRDFQQFASTVAASAANGGAGASGA